MKRKIDFGKIDYYKTGKKINAVTVELELEEKEGGLEFTASATVWNSKKTDCVMGGQCLDDLAPYFRNNLLYKKILRLWRLYHLNGMHAECIHQNQMGWREQAGEPVNINVYTMTGEACSRQSEAKKRILKAATDGAIIKATPEERKILKLEYFYKTTEELPENLKEFYKLKEVETKTRGWLDFGKCPKFGLLGKPCPICGHKYGHGWQFFEIPAEDLQQIKNIIEGGAAEC